MATTDQFHNFFGTPVQLVYLKGICRFIFDSITCIIIDNTLYIYCQFHILTGFSSINAARKAIPLKSKDTG